MHPRRLRNGAYVLTDLAAQLRLVLANLSQGGREGGLELAGARLAEFGAECRFEGAGPREQRPAPPGRRETGPVVAEGH